MRSGDSPRTPCGAVSAVHDGYVLNSSITRSPVGGALLNEALLASVQDKGGAVHPRYLYTKIDKTGVGIVENTLRDLPTVTQSHRRWAVSHIVGDMKESHCRCAALLDSLDSAGHVTGIARCSAHSSSALHSVLAAPQAIVDGCKHSIRARLRL